MSTITLAGNLKEGNSTTSTTRNICLPSKLNSSNFGTGIPHDEDKQLSGPSLRILGYGVDANAMVSLPDEKKDNVVQLLRSNAHEGKRYTISELQSVAGSVASLSSLSPLSAPSSWSQCPL